MKKSFLMMVALAAMAAAAEETLVGGLFDFSAGRPGKTGTLVEMSNETSRRISALFAKRIDEIRQTPNSAVPAGAPCRYLSPSGCDDADGLTPQRAWRTIARLNREKLARGTYVLFERGGLYRGSVTASPGVTYTAYGQGAKPCITSSPMNGADPAKWEKTDVKDIWRCQVGTDDVGTLVFDGGPLHAIKIVPVYNKDGSFTQQYGGRPFNNGYADLAEDLHFWHDYSAKTKFRPHAKGSGWLYLKSKENPGRRFASIEFCVRRHGFALPHHEDVTIDNVSVMYVGSHGVGAGGGRNLTVKNCSFAWIGGSIQAEDLFRRNWPVRYGNAVEIWGRCDGYTIDNCHVRDVYDAALTHQYSQSDWTGAAPKFMKNVRYTRNVIERCNYSIEYFLSGINNPASNPSRMENVLFEGNLMRDAAVGLCRQRPDLHQGAHIKSWRYYGGAGNNRATGFVIRDNVLFGSRCLLIEISSGLMNADGSDSMPEMTGNVIVGERGQRFGVLNQGRAVEFAYDERLLENLGKRYSGNVFAVFPPRAAQTNDAR
jgi:hypothetical protein